MPVKLLALSGSLREGSFNQMLVNRAAAIATQTGADVTSIHLSDYRLPIYDQAVEASAFPKAAIELKRLFASHDGFLIASPEHNGSISAALKNVIDWVSRPAGDEAPLALTGFRGKTVGVMSASIGPFGGLRSLAHLRQILGTIQALVATEQVLVPFAAKAFEGEELVDELPNALLPPLVQRVIELAEK